MKKGELRKEVKEAVDSVFKMMDESVLENTEERFWALLGASCRGFERACKNFGHLKKKGQA